MERKKFPLPGVSALVFSKDRAMQLEAFVSSFLEMVTLDKSSTLFVLYKCSSKEHQSSYDLLIKRFCNEEITFVEEKDFRADVLKILMSSKSKTISFFVDDMIFLNKVNFEEISRIDTSKYTLSLSRG